jgi:hypothetical protein
MATDNRELEPTIKAPDWRGNSKTWLFEWRNLLPIMMIARRFQILIAEMWMSC